MNKILFPSFALVALFFMTLIVPGCGPKEDSKGGDTAAIDSQKGEEDAARQMAETFFSDEIRSLPAETLTKLGARNDLPAAMILPNALSARIIRPFRFLQFENADKVIRFFGNSPNLVPYWNQFDKMDLMLLSDKIASVQLLDPKDNKVIGEHYPLPARATYVRKNAPVDSKGVLESYFGSLPKERVQETAFSGASVTMVEESLLIPLDETGKNSAKIDGIVTAIHFPSENEVVIVNGPRKIVEEFFSIPDGDQRGVLAQRIGRMDADRFDFAFLYDYLSPQKQAISLPLSGELLGAIMENADSLQFTIDAAAPDGQEALKLEITADAPEKLESLDEALGSALLQFDETLQENPVLPEGEEAQETFADSLNGLSGILKTITKEKSGDRLAASIKKSPELVALFGQLVDAGNRFAEESVKEVRRGQTAQNLSSLSQFIRNVYYPKKNHFPPMAITAEDGTPLLSWRVALLPLMGSEGEALYKEFKLDQPWDGPDNIRLLDRMPPIYRSPSAPGVMNKTTFQIFTGPETPFGKTNAPLKIHDFENPGKTFMIVAVEPARAIEWTRPDDLIFDETRLSEIVGNFVMAAPVMGEVFTAPFSGTPDEVKGLSDWVYGRADETEDQEISPTGSTESPLESDDE